MLFNHLRKLVSDSCTGEVSLCPDCGSNIIAKMGDIVAWHWAHKSNGSDRVNCPHKETSWHLNMKSAYLKFKNWEVEYPIVIEGKQYRIDAMNPCTGAAREFVHSLSPHYVDKHLRLKRCGYDVLWIFDGSAFASLNRILCADGRITHLLKPKAKSLHNEIGGLVHCDGRLYRHWKRNIWFECQGEKTIAILRNMA